MPKPKPATTPVRYACCRRLIGPLFKTLAQHHGLTLGKLMESYAAQLDVSPATLRAWQSGTSKPTGASINLLAHDGVHLAQHNRAWCEDFLNCVAAPADIRQAVLSELFPTPEVAPASSPAASAPSPTPTPFMAPPAAPFSLVGRAAELRDIRHRLFAGGQLALTAVHGLPGMGKTTLATALAHDPETRRHFSNGVLWAGLGRRPDLPNDYRRWARALGLDIGPFNALPSDRARAQALHDAIGARRMLLVVDDAWSAEAALAFRLGSPNVAHVLTTRFPLIAREFAGDNVIVLNDLPPAQAFKLFTRLAPDIARHSPAAVKSLLAQTGGLPLAIQVMARHIAQTTQPLPAAQWTQHIQSSLSPGARLYTTQPLSPLEMPSDMAGHTSLSLFDAINRSFGALSPHQQAGLVALAHFAPKPQTFSREAAQTVLGMDDNALAAFLAVAPIDPVGPQRLTLHQTIHDFAEQQAGSTRLISSADGTLRFVNYWLAWVDQHPRDYILIEEEYAHLQRVLDVARQHHPTHFVHLVNALYRYFNVQGLLANADVHVLFEAALQVSRNGQDYTGEAWTLLHLSNIAHKVRADVPTAVSLMQQAIALYETRVHDVVKHGDALMALAEFYLAMSEDALAHAAFQTGIAFALTSPDPQLITHGYNGLGQLAAKAHDHLKAIEWFQKGITIAEQTQYNAMTTLQLRNAGFSFMALARYEEAKQYFRAALQLAEDKQLIVPACNTHMALSTLAEAMGQLQNAESHAKEAIHVAGTAHSNLYLATTHRALGGLYLRMKRFDEARSYLSQALDIAQRMGNHQLIQEIDHQLLTISLT